MIYRYQTWSLTKALVKKLETSQRAMEMKMLHFILRGRIRNTIIRQRTRMTDTVQIRRQCEMEMSWTHRPGERQ